MKAEAYLCGCNVKTCWLCCCLPVCCVKRCCYCSCSVAEESKPKKKCCTWKKCCTCKKSKKPVKKEKVDDEISDQKENGLEKVEKKSEAKREECSISLKMNCGKCK
ncbi:sodium-dependent phosphate transport protein 2B-like isoform X2 [Pistacia vera]|uniref:Uncharacterized protein n=1 Tax=Pistacia atlantica TaxID=434234 RepID=A0ACC1A3H3_9ROSI|nr:sodium-dependent phosphate transport protein 2B-like isoform X2 [Pistacia vera]KAJ0080918.1 hypothetical protein Patl1_11508 [Pistacia atlantica]